MLKTRDVTVAAENRDKGKVFRISEMPADQAEEWGWRAMSTLARSGVEIPPVDALGSLVVVAAYGFQALLTANFGEAKPLLAEMMACVTVVPDPAGFPQNSRPLIASDTEEMSTRFWLRDQVLELHTGFSVAAALSNLKAQAVAAKILSPASTPTSPDLSALS